WKNSQLSIVDKEQNILMEDWLRELAEKGREVLFLSPDLHLYKEMITDLLGELAIFPEGPFHLASPSHLALAGKYKPADHTHVLTSNYLRLAEAEANWIKSQKENQHSRISNSQNGSKRYTKSDGRRKNM